ncbi:MAG: hypothetical protein WBQ72_09990 [Terriglobales bacterium]|jgi:hypothetical protein
MIRECAFSLVERLKRADTRFKFPRILAVVRLGWPIKRIGDWLELSEEWFARVLGMIVAVTLGLRIFVPFAAESAKHRFHEVADVVALLIFATWLGLTILRTTLLSRLESQLVGRFHGDAPTCYCICNFTDLPSDKQDDCAESMAILAYNRWTFNATLDGRRRFFRTLARKYPEGISVTLMYYQNSSTVKCVGYTAVVPLPIASYQRHLFAECNLFDQDDAFFLDSAQTAATLAKYKDGTIPASGEGGLAIYILGMNIAHELEREEIRKAVFRNLISRLKGLIDPKWPVQPFLYTATGIESVMKLISRNGFSYKGRQDVRGNKFWESLAEPETPGSTAAKMRKPRRRETA